MSGSTTQTRTEVGGSGGESHTSEIESLQEQLETLQQRRRECTEDEDERTNGTVANLSASIAQIGVRIRFLEDFSTEDGESESTGVGVIQIGSVVSVLTNKGRERQFTMMVKGSKGKDIITSCSPWGEALLGKRAGDEATALTPGGPVTWKVLAVS